MYWPSKYWFGANGVAVFVSVVKMCLCVVFFSDFEVDARRKCSFKNGLKSIELVGDECFD